MSEKSGVGTESEDPDIARSVVMFILTLGSVYLVYGFQWTAGNPLSDGDVAWESFQFSLP